MNLDGILLLYPGLGRVSRLRACLDAMLLPQSSRPVPHSPRGLCERKATSNLKLNARGRAKHEPSNHQRKSGSPLKTQTESRRTEVTQFLDIIYDAQPIARDEMRTYTVRHVTRKSNTVIGKKSDEERKRRGRRRRRRRRRRR